MYFKVEVFLATYKINLYSKYIFKGKGCWQEPKPLSLNVKKYSM